MAVYGVMGAAGDILPACSNIWGETAQISSAGQLTIMAKFEPGMVVVEAALPYVFRQMGKSEAKFSTVTKRGTR